MIDAKELPHSLETIVQMVDLHNEEAEKLIETEPRLALEKAKEAESLSREAVFDGQSYAEGLVQSMLHQAKAYDIVGEYGNMLQIVLEAESLAEESSVSRSLYGRTLRLIASAYHRLGDYPKAVTMFQKTSSIAETVNDVPLLLLAQNGIGVAYVIMEDFEKAIDYFLACIDIQQTEKGHDERELSRYYCNIMATYIFTDEPEKAIEFGLKAAEFSDPIGKPSVYTGILGNLGFAYSSVGDYGRANDCFSRLFEVLKTVPDMNLPMLYLIYGESLCMQARFDEAEEMGQYALDLATESGNQLCVYKCHLLLSEVAEKQGDLDRALVHHKQFYEIKNEMEDRKNRDQIRFLRISHEVDVAQQEAEILRLRTEELEKLVRERTAEVLQALEQSEKANIVRSNMLKTIMHEFRTPLTVINSSSSLLRKHSAKMPPEKQEKLHTQITESAQYLSHLLSEVSKVENSSTGNLEPNFSSVTMGKWSEKLCKSLERQAEYASNVTFVFDAADETIIEIDKKMTKAIVFELLTNAVKYTPEDKPITVEIGVDGENVVITVADEGMGIAADEIDNIFELFYRAYKAGDISGLGTGLYVVMAMVTALEGEIGVKSDGVDRGTSFLVKLPKLPRLGTG